MWIFFFISLVFDYSLPIFVLSFFDFLTSLRHPKQPWVAGLWVGVLAQAHSQMKAPKLACRLLGFRIARPSAKLLAKSFC